MKEGSFVEIPKQTKPLLLFDDECAVCRHIAHRVIKLARSKSGETSLIVNPIGNDPELLRSLNPDLNIWDAYETIHILMPDGSMKLGGEAIAEVLRNLPNTKWFTWTLALSILGFRPFQAILNLAYSILADVRPLFGCESCGTPGAWVKPIIRTMHWAKTTFGGSRHPSPTIHFTSLSAAKRQAMPVTGEHPPQAGQS